MASLKTRVTRVCTELVDELKFLQMLAIRREAKSRSAQWLSTSGRVHSFNGVIVDYSLFSFGKC